MSEPVSQSILGSLGINGRLFIGQLVNFAVILFVVWRWVYKPLLRMMDEREKKISGGLRNAETAERRMAECASQTQSMRRRAEQDAEQLMEDAKKQAEEKRRQIMDETQKELDRQLSDAKERLAREKEIVLDSARREVVDLVTLALEKIAPGVARGEHGKKFIDDAVMDLERA